MKPIDADVRPAVIIGTAPSSSKFLIIRADDKPEPELKARHLLARAAPASLVASLLDPAFGKVKVTVDVDEESSETTVSPLGRVVTET